MNINTHNSIDHNATLSTGPVRRTVHAEVGGTQSLFRKLAVGMMALVAGETMDLPHAEPLEGTNTVVFVEDRSGELPEAATEISTSPSAGPMETHTVSAAELIGDQTQEFTNFYTTYSTFDAYQAPINTVVA